MSWIVPVASAVIGAAGSYFSAKKSKDAANKLAGQQQPLIDVETQTAKSLQPYATGFYQRAQQAYDPAFKYYSSLMSGNRGDLVSALAPEISGINRSYQTAQQTAGELSPRGGASAAFLAEQPYRRASEVQALISGGRSGAASSLANLAQTAGSLGSGAAGNSLQAATGAAAGNTSLYNSQQNAAAQQAAMYQQMAQALNSSIHWDADEGKWGWGSRPAAGGGISDGPVHA